MLRQIFSAGISCAALSACNVDADVNQFGGYTFLPGSYVADTAALPLRHLIIVERDSAAELSLVYYFEGDLGKAGLGLEDLRRKALRHGGFSLRFAFPPTRYAQGLEPEEPGGGVRADIDGEQLVLSALDTEALYAVGASRFLRTLDDPEYPVRAYFSSVARASDLAALRLELEGDPLSYTFALAASDATPSLDGNSVSVSPGTIERAGELEIELAQDVIRLSDEAELETGLFSLLAPGASFEAPASVVFDAFSRNCWSTERPLHSRVTQLFQRYEARANGDFAVIERRRDSAELEPERLASFVADDDRAAPPLATYCSDFR
jgi:hypothetical protein